MYVIDYLLVIALDEEYRAALDALGTVFDHKPIIRPHGPVVSMLSALELGDATDEREELLVAVCPGQMGHAPIAAALPDILDRWRPRDIILIGISGSLDPTDLVLGDVLVPMKVFGYAEAKVERAKGKESWKFRSLGDRTTSGTRIEVQTICDTPTLVRAWRQGCRRAVKRHAKIADKISEARDRPKIHIHHNDALASGNVVVASKQFGKELQGKVSPTIRAVDMEAGGLFEALSKRDWRGNVLVIRGISDYADKSKSRLERGSNDQWRFFAMQNAVRVAAVLIRQRPRWNAERRSVSPGYELSFKPARGSIALCAQMGMRNPARGALNAAFTSHFQRTGGTPELELLVEVVGQVADGDVRLAVREQSNASTDVRYGMDGPRRLRIRKPATAAPYSLDLFFSASSRDAGIRVSVKDEFGRGISRSFPAPSGE